MSSISLFAYLHQRPNILVLDRSLPTDFVESTSVTTIPHALILQITLSSLIANRAVERVVGEQELHDTLAGFVNQRRVGLDPHAGLYGPGA